MKRLSSFKLRLQAGFGFVVVAAGICAVTIACLAADPKPASEAKPAGEAKPPADAKPASDASSEKKTTEKPKKKKLTGGELYQIHCNRCHPERYATEWTAAEWKTIMLHMRVRANLPAEQAKAVRKYLEEDSGK